MTLSFQEEVKRGIPDEIPPPPPEQEGVSHAPPRKLVLDERGRRLALANALRYFPEPWHRQLAEEFARELLGDGRIYMRRFRPAYPMYARPIDEYPARCRQAAAIMHMIQNNLDPRVAQHPYELITYGGNGTVFQNWAQYLLTMKYLSEVSEEQTLVLYSGHPLGLFPSHPQAPRLVLTCGMVIPNHSQPEDYDRLAALGVTSYGQMTAGSFMYIGPQGIVHGTTITLLNAGRLYLKLSGDQGLAGKVFVSSGLGGMSGAQAKAAVIAGAVGVIAEIDPLAVHKRHQQGWLMEVEEDLDKLLVRVERARRSGEALSIGYLGNVVDLLEYIDSNDIQVDLISDQTSCHVPYDGGYTPAGVSFAEGREILASDPGRFRELVDESLRRHFRVIKSLTDKGARFWDYGNAFMKAVFDAGEPAIAADGNDPKRGFIWPSYVEDIMGPLCFDFGYGPFRWVCLSGKAEDLRKTDQAAMNCIDPNRRGQDRDNWQWIRDAGKNDLVVGTQARILYSDAEGRTLIAKTFNTMVRDGEIGPVMMGRDHHDTGGTDSPYRETANIYDGSNTTADMAHQCWAGNTARGMTMAVLSNGGGVGTGKAINGGFGLVLDGSEKVDRILDTALDWDTMCGVSRRAWARNPNAISTIGEWNQRNGTRGHITTPRVAEDALLEDLIDGASER